MHVVMFLFSNGSVIEFESGDVIKIKFLKLRDLSECSDRTTSKWSTYQKLGFRGKLSLKY